MKNTLSTLAICLFFTAVNLGVTAYTSDLSAFTATQQYQLENWWADKWVAYFGGNVTVEPYPEAAVMRDGESGIFVKKLTVKGEGNSFVEITPIRITCYNEKRQEVCSIP